MTTTMTTMCMWVYVGAFMIMCVCVLAHLFKQSSGANPCTVKGQEYYPVAGDRNKFVKCDLVGNPSIMNCPTDLVWEQKVITCVYPYEAFLLDSSQGHSGEGSSGIITDPNIHGAGDSPCTQNAISAGRFYFPHPQPEKFIQCDFWGKAYVMSCPKGYLWNAKLVTCYDPFPWTFWKDPGRTQWKWLYFQK